MKHENTQDYKSSWEWAKAHSNYHFDNTRTEFVGDWFDILGYFQGADWSEETARLIKNTHPVNWGTRKFLNGGTYKSPMLPEEKYDIEQGGGNPEELELTDVSDDMHEYPIISKMIDYLGIAPNDNPDKRYARAHVQKTGQMFNRHIDKLWDRHPEDPEQIVRLTIMLQDWEPGQFYTYGNIIYSHWRAGEVHSFDWMNVPHATANASNHPRPAVQITGLKTDRTRELLTNADKNNIFTI
jgi:hypothetical protein